MPSDHANEAAAIAAGYKKLQIDRGATGSSVTLPRFVTILEKAVTGVGGSGGLFRARGESNVSAAAADTAAFNALQKQRRARYGDGVAVGTGPSGDALTVDVC